MHLPEHPQDFTCVTDLTPTLCDLLGARRPAQCQAQPLAAVLQEARRVLQGAQVEKALIFAPDAVGCHLWERFPEQLARVEALAPVRVPVRTGMPSVTPVCFASMYSGALPDIHGIREYAKPILTVETLFNTLPEAGKRTVISAVNNCSIDTIFRRRPVTYLSNDLNDDVMRYSTMTLEGTDCDVLLHYAMDYDHIMHATGPFSERALDAFRQDIDDFETLVALADRVWSRHNRLYVFCPDHGAHQTEPGRGGHGSDRDEDLLVYHFYAIRKAQG